LDIRSPNQVNTRRRVQIFVALSLALLALAVGRLAQMQLPANSAIQAEITALKRQRAKSQQFKTLRGKILDRQGNVLATDTPQFQISINYQLTKYWDARILRVMHDRALEGSDPLALDKLYEEVTAKRDQIERVVKDCTKFGVTERYVSNRIKSINNGIWNSRAFLAWYRNGPDPNFVASYGKPAHLVPARDALTAFARQVPDPNERGRMIVAVDDVPEVNEDYFLADLRTEDDIFTAQMEFMDINDVQIVSKGKRHYPYGPAAAQTIGWVGLATQPSDIKVFEHDRLASYLPDDICGKQPGVEYACEAILRGRRGELVRDIDDKLVRSTETQFGRDVRLTLDIDLQDYIETCLTDPSLNPTYYESPMSAVVIEVESGDILALVSLPSFDLNRVQENYSDLIQDSNRPLINRTINKQYPPGSSVKPIIFVAAMEDGKVTPDEVISCPAEPAKAGFPNCWIYKQNKAGHDWSWQNNARNAIKGSCNIYFSHIADRLEPSELQRWLYTFGYGHRVPVAYPKPPDDLPLRRLRQAPGCISTKIPTQRVTSPNDLPVLYERERPYFGIGQGNLRATPLQVANSYATLARGGHYKPPRLFLAPTPLVAADANETRDLGLSAKTLQVVRDGMNAVVNESGGTAQEAFIDSGLAKCGVRVRGKTGSTEGPEHAWFAGYAEDEKGIKIAVAIVIEGGQHGSSDAAPLASKILQLCVLTGYIGNAESLGQ